MNEQDHARLSLWLIDQIGDLTVRLEAFRVVLENHGVSHLEIEQKYVEMKAEWQIKIDADLHRALEADTIATLRKLLESHDGRPQ
jgi:hypothetical protein